MHSLLDERHRIRQVASLCWHTWGLPAIAALALTPLALIAHSYKFVNDDQILYIPILRRVLDPSLYPGDFFFDQPQASVSFFEDFLAWPVRWFGLEWTMFLGYLLAQMLILLCLYSLAVRLVSRRAAYLAMVLFVLPVSIGGTFVRTYDNYLNPRTLTLPLALLALVALLDRRLWRATILIGLHLALHPLSGLHTWLVAAVLMAWWFWKKDVPRRSLIGPALVLSGMLGLLALKSGEGSLWLDSPWRAVLWNRTSYIFLASWGTKDWVSLGLYLLLGIIGWTYRRRDPAAAQLCLAAAGVALGALLMVALGGDWLGVAPLAQLQLARTGWLVIALGVIFGADLAFALYERGGWGARLVAALCVVTIYSNRADEEWLPALALLLSLIAVARLVERYQGAPGRRWADAILLLGGMILLIPACLAAWSATKGSPLLALAAPWRLPVEAAGPAVVLFGLLAVTKNWQSRPTRLRGDWVRIGVGGGLLVAALLPMAETWRQTDWSAYLNARLQLPTGDAWASPEFRAWRDVQLWAATSTSLDARFVTDPDDAGFRVFSTRSTIVENKDGAPAMFSRAYALEWDKRMQAVAVTGVVDPDKKTELTSFSAEGLAALHALYPFDYVVGRIPQSLPWPEVYRNPVFVIYAWPR
jgi:hypothetical protein